MVCTRTITGISNLLYMIILEDSKKGKKKELGAWLRSKDIRSTKINDTNLNRNFRVISETMCIKENKNNRKIFQQIKILKKKEID